MTELLTVARKCLADAERAPAPEAEAADDEDVEEPPLPADTASLVPPSFFAAGASHAAGEERCPCCLEAWADVGGVVVMLGCEHAVCAGCVADLFSHAARPSNPTFYDPLQFVNSQGHATTEVTDTPLPQEFECRTACPICKRLLAADTAQSLAHAFVEQHEELRELAAMLPRGGLMRPRGSPSTTASISPAITSRSSMWRRIWRASWTRRATTRFVPRRCGRCRRIEKRFCALSRRMRGVQVCEATLPELRRSSPGRSGRRLLSCS